MLPQKAGWEVDSVVTGWLVLEDGTRFEGRLFGAGQEASGEVVCNTGVTGYQEALTDPACCGQIVVLSYPVIGNLGASLRSCESPRPYLKGLVVRQLADHRDDGPGELEWYLRGHGVVGLEEVDTRALVRHLRERGSLRGVISTSPQASVGPGVEGPRVAEVTTPWPYRIYGDGPRVVVVDCGLRLSTLRALVDRYDCDVTVVPATTGAADILDFRPDGVLISSGPGQAADLPGLVETVRSLLGRVPLFGIGLGHQLLGLALGVGTRRLKFGHRGMNHPVRELASGRILITAQNHGFALEEEGVAEAGLEVTHRSCHDGTVEGTCHPGLPVFGVDFHPQSPPGPADAAPAFERFWKLIQS